MNAGFPNLQRWMRSIVITAGPSAREFRAFPPPPRAARRISNVRLPRGLPAQCSLLPRGRMVAVLPRPEQELRSAPLRRGAAPGLRAAPRAVLLRDLFSHSSPPTKDFFLRLCRLPHLRVEAELCIAREKLLLFHSRVRCSSAL